MSINTQVNSRSEFYKLRLSNFRFKKKVYGIPYITEISNLFYKLVTSQTFVITMTIIVLLNIAVLSSDYYGISEKTSSILSEINSFCTMIFTIEIVLKITGHGFKNFIRDNMNIFECFIVTLSIIEYFLSQSSGFNAFRSLRIFRLFRVLKVMRIFRYTRSLVLLLTVIKSSMSKFIYLLLLLLLMLVLFTLLGMEIFESTFDFPEGLPRNNFDSFHWAFVTMFQVLSSENWDYVLRICMRSSAGHWSGFFIIVWLILGNFIILNLFLALLLGAFESDHNIDGNETIKFNRDEIFQGFLSKAKKEEKARERILEHFINEEEGEIYSLNDLNIMTFRPTGNLDNDLEEKSMGMLSTENSVRKTMLAIVLNTKFEIIIIFIIALNIIKLVWDTYILSEARDSPSEVASTIIDSVFTFIFALEFIMKTIALGFCWGKRTYLADRWNKLDFVILILSLIDISLITVNIGVVKVFRAMRIFRPLRLIRYNSSMKVILKSLFESIIACLNVVIVIFVIWYIFAILGVALFRGKMYSCENTEITTRDECESMGFTWIKDPYNYDNIFEALLTLFIVGSQEAWPTYMFNVVDAYQSEHSAIKNYNPLAAYYIIIYVFIGDFFMINLFTVVVYSKFTEAKQEESSLTSVLLTKPQMNWLEIQSLILKSKPELTTKRVHESCIKRLATKLITKKAFKMFIVGTILVNTIHMAMYYEDANVIYTESLDITSQICTSIFILEAIAKILSLGFRGYFISIWNRFDFFVVVCSVAFLILESSIKSDVTLLKYAPQLIRVLRVLRLSKFLSLFESLNYIRDLLNVIMFSMPAALNVLCLMLMIFIIYAVLGAYLFWQVRGEIIDEHFNFSNFHMAMMILWRISTGEDYPKIMYDCSQYYNTKTISIYFTSFVMLSTFILTEFFVSVIIQNYKEFMENPISAVRIFNTVVKKFKRVWLEYSKDSGGIRVSSNQLYDLLKDLGSDIGISSTFPKNKLNRFIYSMRVTIDDDDFVYYHDLLYGLMRRRYSKSSYRGSENFIRKILAKEELNIYKKLKSLRDEQKAKFVKGRDSLMNEKNYSDKLVEFYYIDLCFAAWRRFVNIKEIRRRKLCKWKRKKKT